MRTFDITPASSTPLIFIAVIGIILFLIIGLLAFFGYSARNIKFEVSDQGLRIKGGIYGSGMGRCGGRCGADRRSSESVWVNGTRQRRQYLLIILIHTQPEHN